jgi:hypothetical protein
VGVVRGDHGDDVNAVVALGFPFCHLAIVVVHARYAYAARKLGRRCRVTPENPGSENVLIVEPHRMPVRGADHCTGAPADHPRHESVTSHALIMRERPL